MVNLKSVKVNLPTATTATGEARKDLVSITVDKTGLVFVDKKPAGNHELMAMLSAMRQTNSNVRVFISGDRDARHGDVIHVLDLVRSAGIEKVAFETRPGLKRADDSEPSAPSGALPIKSSPE
jgi:biopolymer transport protein ExbD